MWDPKVSVAGLPAGIIILGAGFLMMMIGFTFIQKIVDIEV
jgi:Flp pilus assembly protein TadB